MKIRRIWNTYSIHVLLSRHHFSMGIKARRIQRDLCTDDPVTSACVCVATHLQRLWQCLHLHKRVVARLEHGRVDVHVIDDVLGFVPPSFCMSQIGAHMRWKHTIVKVVIVVFRRFVWNPHSGQPFDHAASNAEESHGLGSTTLHSAWKQATRLAPCQGPSQYQWKFRKSLSFLEAIHPRDPQNERNGAPWKAGWCPLLPANHKVELPSKQSCLQHPHPSQSQPSSWSCSVPSGGCPHKWR